MNRIDQAIRESLLESYIYLESCGEMSILNREVFIQKLVRNKSLHLWFRYEEVRKNGYRWQENNWAYDMEPKKELYLIHLDSYVKAIQMQEIQISRAE
jgi:hypothetical protein